MTKIFLFNNKFICLILLFCVSGCSYFSSGTWENDTENWGRAFHSAKPDDVVVLHSLYWRSPHWTNEFQYFFEIERNDKIKKQLFEANKLIKIEGEDAIEAKSNFFGKPPKWFAPKTVDKYEIWIIEDKPGGSFRVFVDKETGNIFLTDYQY